MKQVDNTSFELLKLFHLSIIASLVSYIPLKYLAMPLFINKKLLFKIYQFLMYLNFLFIKDR
jgi:hypothetical protein